MSSPTFGSKGSFSQVWIRGDLAWKSFALDNNNSQPWDLYGPQSLMSQLLNKQVLIGLPLLKERLANMDQMICSKFPCFIHTCLFPLAFVSVQAEGGTGTVSTRSSAPRGFQWDDWIVQGHSESLPAFPSPQPQRAVVLDCGSPAWYIKSPKHKTHSQKAASGILTQPFKSYRH